MISTSFQSIAGPVQEATHHVSKSQNHNKVVLPPIQNFLSPPKKSAAHSLSNSFSHIGDEIRNFARIKEKPVFSNLQNESKRKVSSPIRKLSSPIPSDFEKLTADFSSDAQLKFEKALHAWELRITHFQKTFNENNKAYQRAHEDERRINEEEQESFCQLKKREQAEYFELGISYHKFQEYCHKRTIKLTTAIAQHKLELALLDQVVEENRNQPKIRSESAGYRFRHLGYLFEINNQQITRAGHEALPLQSVETCDPFSKLSLRFRQTLRQINILKQLVLRADKAFKKDFAALSESRLPHKYYAYHAERLADIKESFQVINEDFNQEYDKLRTHENRIDLYIGEDSIEDPPIIKAIRTKKDAILETCHIIGQLLLKRKTDFLIPESPVPINYPDYGENPIWVLIEEIESLKEDMVLNEEIDLSINRENRDLKKSQLAKRMQQMRLEAELEIWPQHNQLVQARVKTYQDYIRNLKQGLADIQPHLKSVCVNSLARVAWTPSHF